jgi:Zn-dependent protease
MLRFRLGSIPVNVHPTHALVSALLAYAFLPRPGSLTGPTAVSWPYRHLLTPTDPRHGVTLALYILSWVLIIFLSTLVHELGHALVGRFFGYRPSILLKWMGGVTQMNSPSALPWHHLVLINAAGPGFGLLLATASLAGRAWASGRSEGLYFLCTVGAVANFVWALFNLLPVPPLDGGHIVSAVATRFFGQGGFIAAQGLALVVSVALVALAVVHGDPLLGAFFVLFGLQAMRLLLAVWRGEMRLVRTPPEPLVRALKEGREALAHGRPKEARQLALSVLEAEETTPELDSRAHHLLGWVALKEGQGRMALDHFSQVQRRAVETHALAAAFSLLGDEPRALSLWELAWQERRDATVLHEYAGSLIRSAREQEALRLPGVEPEAAFTCAGRTLFIRGAYSEAAALAEAGLARVPSARLAYDAACAQARARHRDDAVRLLHRATALGFQDANYAASDEDLSSLHGHPSFEQWLAEQRKSASA